MTAKKEKIAILGGGNIGMALARGLVKSGNYSKKQITITRRRKNHLDAIVKEGFLASNNNAEAILGASIIVLAVLPQSLNEVLDEIRDHLNHDQLLISVISGVSTQDVKDYLKMNVPVVRAMPNTAISIQESMTCIAAKTTNYQHIEKTEQLFQTVGDTVVINESEMTAATALCACGIAFFLRFIRAASQGGTEIGFHSHDALKMAVQTALGAASLLSKNASHPEDEIDKVTSPKGCTIAGLNEMEHQGFSSSLIKGIITSYNKAGNLYCQNDNC